MLLSALEGIALGLCTLPVLSGLLVSRCYNGHYFSKQSQKPAVLYSALRTSHLYFAEHASFMSDLKHFFLPTVFVLKLLISCSAWPGTVDKGWQKIPLSGHIGKDFGLQSSCPKHTVSWKKRHIYPRQASKYLCSQQKPFLVVGSYLIHTP